MTEIENELNLTVYPFPKINRADEVFPTLNTDTK